jgi:RNA polymerase sigma-70 factor (ECF subfamily)
MKNVKIEYQNMQIFEKVCLIYSKDLQRFIYTLTRKDRFAMEEIYQNTMLGALKGLNYLRDSSRMKSWIFAIAKAEARRYYAGRPENYDGIQAAEEGQAGLDFTKTVEDKEYVKDLLLGLPDEEQQLYILHYYYDLQLKEISEILNVNYSTVRSMHTRGMARMRKQLRERDAAYE